jgi:hypothetical protein
MAERSPLGGLASLVAAGTLVALAGPLGGVAGAALFACWYALGPTYAFAVGQVAIVALVNQYPLPYVIVAESAVFAVLLSPDLGSSRGRRLVGGTVLATVTLGGLAYGTLVAWGTLWATALVVLVAIALVTYTVHRYELVTNGGVATTHPV